MASESGYFGFLFVENSAGYGQSLALNSLSKGKDVFAVHNSRAAELERVRVELFWRASRPRSYQVVYASAEVEDVLSDDFLTILKGQNNHFRRNPLLVDVDESHGVNVASKCDVPLSSTNFVGLP